MKIKFIKFLTFVLGILCSLTFEANADLSDLPIARGIDKCTTHNFSAQDCSRAIEKKILDNGNKTISRKGNTLTICLEGKAISITDKNTTSGENDINYTYLGYESKLGLHIIHMLYSEGDQYKVVHHTSGLEADPNGYPLPSPDLKLFAALSMDMFAGYSPNSIEIWQMGNTAIKKVAIFSPEWGPSSATWLSPNQLQVGKMCYASAEKDTALLKACGTATIELVDETWKITE